MPVGDAVKFIILLLLIFVMKLSGILTTNAVWLLVHVIFLVSNVMVVLPPIETAVLFNITPVETILSTIIKIVEVLNEGAAEILNAIWVAVPLKL